MSDASNIHDEQDVPGTPGAPVPPGVAPDPVPPDQPEQPGGPGVPSPDGPPPSTPGPEPTTPSPGEPTVPTPTEPTFPDPTEPNPLGPPEVPKSTGGGRHAASVAPDGAGNEDDERFVRGAGTDADLSVLARDAAHPFDQTNGIIDRLEGDADDPERVESRLGNENVFERALAEENGDDFQRTEELTEDERP